MLLHKWSKIAKLFALIPTYFKTIVTKQEGRASIRCGGWPMRCFTWLKPVASGDSCRSISLFVR